MLYKVSNNRYYPLLLAILGGGLLFVSWPPLTLNLLLFIAFIPILILEDKISGETHKVNRRLIFFSFLTFFLWNVLATFWIWFASEVGAFMAFFLNSLLMTLPVFLYSKVKRYLGRTAGYISLICFWMTLEFIHLDWDAPWPWMNLGNGFATSINLVQWYEFTGAGGGSLWVLLVNLFFYETIRPFFRHPGNRIHSARPIIFGLTGLALILIPVGLSYQLVPTIFPAIKSNVVAVQPNIDPYEVKFDESTFSSQIETLIKLSESAIDSNTVLVVWPETAIAENVDEKNLFFYSTIHQVRKFLQKHPGLKLLTGTNSFTVYGQEKKTPTARFFEANRFYYDVFNSAVLLDTSDNVSIYHKSKLVPGVEKMPYPRIFGFLEGLAIDLGGTSGSMGGQDTVSVFKINENIVAAPIICYESIFGEYVSQFILKGANLITIITNDGWWRDTPGYKQHMHYAALRAVETRKFIVRSANTGISCFIEPYGQINSETQFWKPGVIKAPLVINNEQTFYTQKGDYIYRTLVYGALLFLVFAIVGKRLRKSELQS